MFRLEWGGFVSPESMYPYGFQRDIQLSAGRNDIQLPQVPQGIVAVLIIRIDMIRNKQSDFVVEVKRIL